MAGNLDSDANEILYRYQTKDHLIPTSDLEVISNPFMPSVSFRLKCPERLVVYPTPEIRGVIDILIHKPELWVLTSIRILATKWGLKRLPIYGVSFRRAVEIVLNEGFLKARFQVPMPERFADRGLVADLLVHLGKNKEPSGSTLELQAWQSFGDAEEVFYIHGILSQDGRTFNHLDGAIIHFDQEDKEVVFRKGEKLKGRSYQKQFRLDGNIQMEAAFAIVSSFFPIYELADEYFMSEATAV